MKKLSFLLFLPFVLCYCKKDGDDTIEFTVKEFKTGTPIEDATLMIKQCKELFCSYTVTTHVSGSDAEGIFTVPADKWNGGAFAEVNHPDYHSESRSFSGGTSIVLTRVAWIRLRLVRTSTYDGTFNLSIRKEGGTPTFVIPSFSFHTPADSTIIVTAYGNQVNEISWSIAGNSGTITDGTFSQVVPRADTVNATLNY